MKKTQDPIKLTQKNGIVTLILNCPDTRNAFDEKMIQILIDHLEEIKKNDTVRVVILTGEGKHFSAGANIDWMRRMAEHSKLENYLDALNLSKLLETLNELNKPTIAVLQGAVYGGAIGLVACCDIVLAAPKTIFCFSEVKLGLIPAVISPYVLNVLGAKACRRHMLTAEPFSADHALALGLVHEIHPIKSLASRVQELTEALLSNGPKALSLVKELLHTLRPTIQTDSDPSEVFKGKRRLSEYTAELIASLRSSPEGQEGLTAFLEKRSAHWTQDLTSSSSKCVPVIPIIPSEARDR